MKSNIALIGFMATGKTTIGRFLSTLLKKDFIDLDNVIETQIGEKISSFIINNEGKFRNLEKKFCENLGFLNNTVISCGGGIVIDEFNVDQLQKFACVILLQAPVEVIIKRVKNDGVLSRPLLSKMNVDNSINLLLKKRQPLYDKAANIIIDTDNLSIEEIASEIINKYQKWIENGGKMKHE